MQVHSASSQKIRRRRRGGGGSEEMDRDSPEMSHNTHTTVPSYQSLDERPRNNNNNNNMSGAHEVHNRSSASSLDDNDNNNEQDIEMGGNGNVDFNDPSFHQLEDKIEEDDDDREQYEEVADVPIVFDMSRMGAESGEDEDEEMGEGEDHFPDPTERASLNGSISSPPKYQWKLYAPDPNNIGAFIRWAMVGGSNYAAEQSDDELMESLSGLARCLHLMREYLYHYGMPERGGPKDQELVLREVIRDLYAGGAPLWALDGVMQKVAEGLTGQPNVNWQLFPRKAFVYNPAAGNTSMFKMDRGFNLSKMSAMEGVVVRLASFASNVQGVNNIPARFPHPDEFQKAARTESNRNFAKKESRSRIARKILNLASKQQGLFYYVNSRQYLGDKANNNDDLDVKVAGGVPKRGMRPHGTEDFWVVTEEERELFSRLACQEALAAIDALDAREADPQKKTIYTPGFFLLARVTASASTCAFWFGGSWQDMIVAGILAIVVAYIGTSALLSKQERLVYEVVASFTVGLTAGLIALTWPKEMCFSAMAISGVLDLLQGFRVVYAIIEIMSKHTVAGGADLLEGILFTGLIAYFIQFGSYVAASIMGDPENTKFPACTAGLPEYTYIFLVPMAALSWSFLFTPKPVDLPAMGFHGVLAYVVNFVLTKAGSSSSMNYFVSATAVSFSAGIFSRFTGRQAVGNTAAGMYALVPGAYLVKSVYAGAITSDFFLEIIRAAVIIGIGGWTGTILCSPTMLGTTRGLLWQKSVPQDPEMRRSNSDVGGPRTDRPGLSRDFASRHLIDQGTTVKQRANARRASGMLMSNPDPKHQGGRRPITLANHRRQMSNATAGSNADSVSSHPSPHGKGKHHRKTSTASYFDFEHPTSTMLFF